MSNAEKSMGFLPPKPGSQEPLGRWEGVADERFREFLGRIESNLVPHGKGYAITASSKLLYSDIFPPDQLRSSIYPIGSELLNCANSLKTLGLIITKNFTEQGHKLLVTRRQDIFILFSCMYARRTIKENGFMRRNIYDDIAMAAQLWGESRYGETLKDFLKKKKLEEERKKEIREKASTPKK